MRPSYLSIGPTYGELTWQGPPSDALLACQLSWMDFLEAEFSDQIAEIQQGFTTLSIHWKEAVNQAFFYNKISRIKVSDRELPSRIWEIPVCYDPQYGRDLETLAKVHRMKTSSLIALHCSPTYRLHFFGFLPGFMYLNGLPSQLHTPRKPVPDRKVEAGSVAIGGSQTGIYPQESPGGWHLIGRSPLSLFDPHKSPPVWAEPGDLIKFVPIGLEEMKSFLQNRPFPQCR